MNKQDILTLYTYNQWANAKILDAAAKVTPEQYLAPASFPHGGLRGTLVHILFAEWIWRNRWQGTSPNYRLKPDDFPTFETLRSRWAEEEKALMAFVDGLTDEKLNSEFSYTSTEGTRHKRILWQAMAHLVNHGTQHRAEAAAILTAFGHSPGDIDLIYFLIEND
ncbi:MAG TPA: DinB family protein [Anaerolineales bacterium]|nr:DinB family protein [Anaerolineales bacterium]